MKACGTPALVINDADYYVNNLCWEVFLYMKFEGRLWRLGGGGVTKYHCLNFMREVGVEEPGGHRLPCPGCIWD